jgi:hypothetical protein
LKREDQQLMPVDASFQTLRGFADHPGQASPGAIAQDNAK